MRMSILATGVLASTALLTPQLASAKDLRIDGFASIYAGQVMDEDELGGSDFRGYEDTLDFHQNSLYGLQFRSDLEDNLSATAQIVGKGAEEFDPKITWAFMKYNFTDAFSVKAGRQRVPFFLYSDFIQVGYAYPWTTPPEGIYNIAGSENIDGVNFEYLVNIGDWTSRTSFLVGGSESTLDYGSTEVQFNNDDFRGLTWDLTYDWLTFHAVYSRSKVTIPIYSQLAGGIAFVLGGLTSEQVDMFDLEKDLAEYKGIGVSGDWGDWLAAAEYAEIELDESPTTSARKSWYVFGGYRWQKFTFGLTYAKYENPNHPDVIAFLNANDAALSVTPLYAGLNSSYRGGKESDAYTATVRYDFHPSAAFKLEYMKEDGDYDMDNGSPVTNLKPALVRMGVDLVF